MRRPPIWLALFLALSLLVPFPAVLHAAVAHLESITSNNSAGTTSDTSASLTSASSTELWVASICYFDATTISTIQLDGSTSFTQVSADNPGTTIRQYIYYLASVPSGAHTVTFNYSGTTGFKRWFVTRISGAHTTTPLDTAGVFAEWTGTAFASGSYSGAATSFYYGFACAGGAYTYAPGSGWTEGAQDTSSMGALVEWKANPGTTSHNADGTVDSSFGGVRGVAFKIAAAVGPPVGTFNLLRVGR